MHGSDWAKVWHWACRVRPGCPQPEFFLSPVLPIPNLQVLSSGDDSAVLEASEAWEVWPSECCLVFRCPFCCPVQPSCRCLFLLIACAVIVWSSVRSEDNFWVPVLFSSWENSGHETRPQAPSPAERSYMPLPVCFDTRMQLTAGDGGSSSPGQKQASLSYIGQSQINKLTDDKNKC